MVVDDLLGEGLHVLRLAFLQGQRGGFDLRRAGGRGLGDEGLRGWGLVLRRSSGAEAQQGAEAKREGKAVALHGG
ncbi:hypothetical protein D9M71_798220 [compost metagenome]